MSADEAGSSRAALLQGLLEQRAASRASRRAGRLDRPVYLHHVRKTGGTSITSAMLSLGGEQPSEVEARLVGHRPRFTVTDGLVVAAHDRLALQTGWFDYGWSHVPAWRMRLPRRIFTVSVLRDPVDRTLSLYRYLKSPTSDVGHVFGARPAERALADGTLEDFLDRLPQTELLNQLYMFSEKLDVPDALACLERCDLVFFTDRLGDGVARLGQVVGRDLPVRTERRSPSSFSPSEAQVSALRERLAPEYELLAAARLQADRRGAGP